MTRWAGMRASLWLAAVITFVALSVAAGAQDRVALVIGNSKYVNVNVLANAANDARVTARALRDIGFAVTDGYDLPRDGMERQIREFLRKSETARVRLFYYAGHGLQVDGRNYLVPVNTKLESANDLSFETIALDTILESLDSTSRTNIIILDACRNNPFAQTFASRYGAGRSVTVQPGLAGYANLGAGMLIAFSTAPGAVALDGAGANSPFTEALARHLRTPGLEVRQMLTRVRADVANGTSGKQIPWDNSALLGDVYLAGAGRTEVTRLDTGGGTPSPDKPGPDKPGKPEGNYQGFERCRRLRRIREQISKQSPRPRGEGARRRTEERGVKERRTEENRGRDAAAGSRRPDRQSREYPRQCPARIVHPAQRRLVGGVLVR
jgi:hypothetical protein